MASLPQEYSRWLTAMEDSIYKNVVATAKTYPDCSRPFRSSLLFRRINYQLSLFDEEARTRVLLRLYTVHGPFWVETHVKDLEGNIWLYCMKESELRSGPVVACLLWIDKREGERLIEQTSSRGYVLVTRTAVAAKPSTESDSLGEDWVDIEKEAGLQDFSDDWQLVGA